MCDVVMYSDVSGNPVLPAGQQIMWNAAANIQPQHKPPTISSPMISPVLAPPTVNMADLAGLPPNVNIQNLVPPIQQRSVAAHLTQVD